MWTTSRDSDLETGDQTCADDSEAEWLVETTFFFSAQEFIHAMRELMTTTLGDQDEAQSLLKKQLADQLAGLDVKEETCSTSQQTGQFHKPESRRD